MSDRIIKFKWWDKQDKNFIDNYKIRDDYEINDAFLSDSIVPLQFTGLLDRNGVEIYEFDYVEYLYEDENRVDNEKCVVEWDDELAGFRPFIQGIKWRCDIKDIKVIGNIYENPELIK